MALHFAWYNFLSIHRSLRLTLSVAAGVTDRTRELSDLFIDKGVCYASSHDRMSYNEKTSRDWYQYGSKII